MSDKNNRRRRKNFGGKSFIILPILFFVGIYLIIYLAFVPSIAPIVSASGLFFSDIENDYSTDYENIFVPVSSTSDVPTINIDDVKFPKYGEQFGELVIEDCNIHDKLFFGDGNIALRNGVGIYNGSFIPGYGKTILVTGHSNTFFNGLKNAEKGQKININTSYGNYVYEITETAVKEADDTSAYDLSADEENLILYTCYPFDTLGFTSQRYFVYAKYISGAQIDKVSKKGE